MRKEAAEMRDFLPDFVARLRRLGARIVLEHGYGAGLGLSDADYLEKSPSIEFGTHGEALRQDIVIVLRCPAEEELQAMRTGACLISMLHYPTRPQRVAFLRGRGLEAVSLDGLEDDSGRRLVENLRAVAWNGMGAAFRIPRRPPIRVTLIGAGAVGSHVVLAAVRYGDEALRRRLAEAGVPGVRVTVVDYDITGRENLMLPLLRETDLLVDATRRPDPSRCIIPNRWIAELPAHAVILDLSVDPYDNTFGPSAAVKAIEGIPQGNLDRYEIAPDDPAYDSLPAGVDSRHRRFVASCYSWPGIHPKECMGVYGSQLRPILRTILERGGIPRVRPAGRFFERAIARALLSRWDPEKTEAGAPS
jgi:alanine dehydrogenase